MTVKSLLYESKSNQITINPPMLNHKAKLMCVRWTKTSLISPQQSHWRASSHPQTERYERDSDQRTGYVHIDLCFTSNRFISAWRQHTCWEQLTHTYNWPTQTGFLTTQCNALDVSWALHYSSPLALLLLLQFQYLNSVCASSCSIWAPNMIDSTSYVTFIEEGTQATSTDHKHPKRPSNHTEHPRNHLP